MFKQHSERPKECEAKKCKCSRGRNYASTEENHKHAFIYCHYCGGHSVHRGCNLGTIFLCEECLTVRHDTIEDEVIDITNRPARPIINSRRSIYNNRIQDGRRKKNVVTIIELSDSDEDYVATYSETASESKTVSVTRTTVCYPLRNCTVQIPRIDMTKLENSSTKVSSDNVMVFDVSDDSALAGDVSMENVSQDNDDGNDNENDAFIEVATVQKANASLFLSESDEETRSADEGERSPLPIQLNYSGISDRFDVYDDSKKVFSSNMMPFSYKEPKSETRSESSGIESYSSFHILSESSSSDDIRKLNQSPEHHSNKVNRTSESSDSSINTSSISSSSSSSSNRMSSTTESTISLSTQSKETADNKQSDNELGLSANQLNSYAVKEEKVTIKTELDDSSAFEFGSNSSLINKRKRTIMHYFGEIASSDEDISEVKAHKRKVSKRSPKSMPSRASNQRSISEMFIKLDTSF